MPDAASEDEEEAVALLADHRCLECDDALNPDTWVAAVHAAERALPSTMHVQFFDDGLPPPGPAASRGPAAPASLAASHQRAAAFLS
jgi:hypothetical protein